MTAAGITGSVWSVSAQAPALGLFLWVYLGGLAGGVVSVGGGVAFGLLLPGGAAVSAGGMVVVVPGDVD
jgi:hypothetical protein